jgi:hypothetical protein
MVYSSAFRTFSSSLKNIKLLIAEERKFPDPPSPEDQHLAGALRGAATMFMVAAFEAYLVEMFSERVEELNVKCRASGWGYIDLDEKLRHHNTIQSLNIALRGPRYPPLSASK